MAVSTTTPYSVVSTTLSAHGRCLTAGFVLGFLLLIHYIDDRRQCPAASLSSVLSSNCVFLLTSPPFNTPPLLISCHCGRQRAILMLMSVSVMSRLQTPLKRKVGGPFGRHLKASSPDMVSLHSLGMYAHRPSGVRDRAIANVAGTACDACWGSLVYDSALIEPPSFSLFFPASGSDLAETFEQPNGCCRIKKQARPSGSAEASERQELRLCRGEEPPVRWSASALHKGRLEKLAVRNSL